MFKRGDVVTDIQLGIDAVVLGPEDFDGYKYNRPNDKWELVLYPDGSKVWVGNIWIRRK